MHSHWRRTKNPYGPLLKMAALRAPKVYERELLLVLTDRALRASDVGMYAPIIEADPCKEVLDWIRRNPRWGMVNGVLVDDVGLPLCSLGSRCPARSHK
jgi:hypothetical protein